MMSCAFGPNRITRARPQRQQLAAAGAGQPLELHECLHRGGQVRQRRLHYLVGHRPHRLGLPHGLSALAVAADGAEAAGTEAAISSSLAAIGT